MTEIEKNSALESILKVHPALQRLENGRIKCTITNHEMLSKPEVVMQHVNGKRYKRLTKDFQHKLAIDEYEPHLTQSNKQGHEHQLFCKLTLKHVNNIPHHIERHINGKKFLKAKKRWEKCKASGEKFIPLQSHNRRRKEERNGDKDETEENCESDDSFSDLYPEKYFGKLSLATSEEDMSQLPPKKNKKQKKKKSTAGVSGDTKNGRKKRKGLSSKNTVSEKKQRLGKTGQTSKAKPMLLTCDD